ncbi:TonB-dependent receptor [Sphingomonas gei]|uniref:TonB-dependent receptor n=1 Tax=Sphingomonas gei TaxID=1395960 RepID=A0A4S1WZT6_9SPHN|nr:TonB-dependent receptor [Sphingomonas gei]TGX49134.1 TonB-dependent receptor [Sphingomonas gei]
MTTSVQTRPSVTTLRPVMASSALSASLATGMMLFSAGKAAAQETPPPPPADKPVQLGPVRVGADEERDTGPNALRHGTQLDRLPDDLQHTPQTVTVIPQAIIQQQQATTIDQVLKYVPGVTVATGEGNGGMNGDAFRIRGFDAKGDLTVDGLRDFGAYVRDNFAVEGVQVFKGSSSESFGNGATGGVINQVSKTAHLVDSYSLLGTLGSGPQKRVVADVNKQIGETTALRLVGMWHDQDIVDRDNVYSKRWGVLASAGFGLGTDQTFTLNYMHQHGDRRPDMGVPILLPPPGYSGPTLPVTEYGVSRSINLGKETDRDLTNVDMVTARYRGQFGDWLTLSNDTRYARYTRWMAFTPTICGTGPGGFVNFGTCSRDVLAGNPNAAYTVWPVVGDVQKSSGGQNVTTAIARFDTGGLKHELVAGADVYYQRNIFGSLTGSRSRTGGTLLNPNFANPAGFTISATPGVTRARAWNLGLFASDHLWLTDTLSVIGGLRWDSYNAKTQSYNTVTGVEGPWSEAKTHFLSPKASIMWEPTPGQNYYVSYARSFTPAGQNISYQGVATPNLSPDKNYTLEAGGKWTLLHDQLGLTAAVFRTIKDRGSYGDPLTGGSVPSGEKDRVQGLELGITGKITPAWDVQASYSYQDSKILAGPPIGNFNPTDSTGNEVAYVSKHNAALWTTYDVATLVSGMPGKLLVGGGLNYRSRYFADSGQTYLIPAATTLDGLISWEDERFRVALNVTNLTDKVSYSSAFFFRAEVAPGRTFTGSVSVKF